MSNYLRGIGRAVGFTEDTDRRGVAGEQGDADWDAVSCASRGEVNILRGARGTGPELPPGGGDRIVVGDTFSAASPTQRDRQQA